MKATWKKNKNLKPKVIFEKIDNLKTVVDGKVTFTGFEHRGAKVALETMIDFPSICNDLDKELILTKAFWEAAKSTPIEQNNFIDLINKNIKEALEKRDETYFLLTSLSVEEIGIRSLELNNCVIRFYKSSFPRKFKGRKELIESKKKCKESESIGYTKVVVELKAKSEYMAAKKALRALDLLRSMFNLFSNSKSEFLGNEWQPINKIRSGEFHTIHNEIGEIFPDVFWFDPSYSSAMPYYCDQISITVKNVKFIINHLNKLNKQYKSIIIDGLLRYVRAFDEKDQNVAVMRAWSALESIAAPNESNCDSVTRRCAFLFHEHEYHKQILEHLREYRNRNVHSGEESNKAKDHGFQIQFYFKELVLFHMRNVGYFNDIFEANKFLDLSTDEVTLTYNKKIVERALKFRGYTA
ncbi:MULTISPECIES: hypothetical protein [Aliivibrio]|uniref:Apea-like HEPN domain-containing protein n=1 Tax=Aliivibrio finisterrensis TaxID=511998 RepID=A0A4Q5KX33_9GAMM|nr:MULTISPECIES: hypothetical protein [Aliivibrio]MDD9178036.1 hypothetical protein [Aliivibrio sp. A6]RYU51991.1 hypothetical protein ERW56_11400 [Aliivibrio finisterrensis]RYU53678.1 hypothetical protein ERW57_03755 [Aliivibrio finisterrensis]RYU57705.1 hypothetical protein ERW50_10810 [Aliivibrio finisterrensis]RYU66123.1 hypothetical protein ERW53_04285 [Aliivibrio finisterrensis]